MLKTALGRLRLVSISEGVSYLVLLGIAMPLTYVYDLPSAVRVVGMLHGVLFVIFAAALFQAHIARRWGFLFSVIIFASSLVPLGAFWMDRKLKALDGIEPGPS